MKKSILLIVLAALLLSFVSYESSTAVAGETKAIDSALVFGYPDATVRMVLEKYKTQYSKIPYFTKFANGKYLFYVVQGNWKEPKNDSFPKGDFKMGVIDEKGNVLLPAEYDKLYNPDGTVHGFIEIEKNGKRGLFNYTTKKIISAEYDVIYQSTKKYAMAVGKKGNTFFYLQSEKLATEINDSTDFPLYSNVKYRWKFDVKGKRVNLYSTSMLDRHYTYYRGNGVYFTTSYMYGMHCFPEIQYFIGVSSEAELIRKSNPNYQSKKGDVVMVYEYRGEIKQQHQIGSISTFLISFYKEGISGRSYQKERTSVITQDIKGNIIAGKLLLKNNYGSDVGCVVPTAVRFISDSLLEVKDYKYTSDHFDENLDSIKFYSKFSKMAFHRYYSIASNGKIFRLESNRIHEFTKYTIVDNSYFDVCDLLENSEMIRMDSEDLDFMIQEIYADYGLIFTDKKWADYFATQTWYKPRYNNVDSLLTIIDKQNLIFIKKKKVEMGLQELKQLEKETGLKSPR